LDGNHLRLSEAVSFQTSMGTLVSIGYSIGKSVGPGFLISENVAYSVGSALGVYEVEGKVLVVAFPYCECDSTSEEVFVMEAGRPVSTGVQRR